MNVLRLCDDAPARILGYVPRTAALRRVSSRFCRILDRDVAVNVSGDCRGLGAVLRRARDAPVRALHRTQIGEFDAERLVAALRAARVVPGIHTVGLELRLNEYDRFQRFIRNVAEPGITSATLPLPTTPGSGYPCGWLAATSFPHLRRLTLRPAAATELAGFLYGLCAAQRLDAVADFGVDGRGPARSRPASPSTVPDEVAARTAGRESSAAAVVRTLSGGARISAANAETTPTDRTMPYGSARTTLIRARRDTAHAGVSERKHAHR